MKEEFIEKVKDAKSAEQVKVIAKEYGPELADDKAEELYKMISNATGGFPDDLLDAVSGGGIVDTIKKWVGSLFGK